MQIVKGIRKNKNVSYFILLIETINNILPSFYIKLTKYLYKKECNIKVYEEVEIQWMKIHYKCDIKNAFITKKIDKVVGGSSIFAAILSNFELM